MSLLIATPMYGGQCTKEYFESCLQLKDALVQQNIEHAWLTTANESLVTRARNTSAATFLKTEFRYFMFIDADISFTADDVGKLWNLQTEVAVAAYPMKVEAEPLSAWVGGELVTDLDSLPNPCPVDYAGTGFMMIRRDVFEKMKRPEIFHQEGRVGDCWAFFDTAVEDGIYWSEDYWFCRKWREAGGRVLMDPTIRLGHVGRRIFGMAQSET
jgi:hypothetical protein